MSVSSSPPPRSRWALVALGAIACGAAERPAHALETPGTISWQRARRGEEALPGPTEAEATSEPGAVLVLRSPEPSQVLFRGGEFTMGAEPTVALTAVELCKRDLKSEDACDFPLRQEQMPLEELVQNEVAAHPVTLSPFWLDRTEVTVEAYARCVALGPCGQSVHKPLVSPETARLPMTMVSHDEAQIFCQHRGGRLPTEAEWERAAKGAGTNGRMFPWGNTYFSRVSNHGTLRLLGALEGPRMLFPSEDDHDGFRELAPVGSFPGGRTPEGIEDLAGNAAEWVADNYADRYDPVSAHDPKGPPLSPLRVIRGGSYISGPTHLRSSARSFASPGVRLSFLGFRCVRPASP
jgi:formylglycine-generating enzyme